MAAASEHDKSCGCNSGCGCGCGCGCNSGCGCGCRCRQRPFVTASHTCFLTLLVAALLFFCIGFLAGGGCHYRDYRIEPGIYGPVMPLPGQAAPGAIQPGGMPHWSTKPSG